MSSIDWLDKIESLSWNTLITASFVYTELSLFDTNLVQSDVGRCLTPVQSLLGCWGRASLYYNHFATVAKLINEANWQDLLDGGLGPIPRDTMESLMILNVRDGFDITFKESRWSVRFSNRRLVKIWFHANVINTTELANALNVSPARRETSS